MASMQTADEALKKELFDYRNDCTQRIPAKKIFGYAFAVHCSSLISIDDLAGYLDHLSECPRCYSADAAVEELVTAPIKKFH